jgi:signal transduction histidine kinase
MSIRLKLILSYIAMLLIPVILTTVAAGILFVVYAGGELGKVDIHGDDLSRNIEQALLSYSDIIRTESENPDQLKDFTYLNSIDEKLKPLNAGLMIVRSDGNVLFASTLIDDPERIYRQYRELRDNPNHRERKSFRDRKYSELMVRDVTFSDSTSASIFLVADLNAINRFSEKYFSAVAYAILIILVITNAGLTFLVSRNIIKPLRLLKHGADQIRDGNLNFEIRSRSRDEIGEVCIAFEQMRRKLKDSIELQLLYEENRKELISNISHDLKTPITAIKGYMEGILDGVADTPEKMNRYIRTVSAKASDMDKLIDDLFLFSKLDMKKLPFHFEKIDPGKYFEDCTEELRTDLEQQNIQLQYENNLPAGTTAVADRDKLKRVIINIVENAVKYMDREQGIIRVSLNNEPDFVRVSVRDNGQGIRKEELSLIFDRFYRADPSRNTATGGSGLGLAIARQIMEAHGRQIWAESEYGKGTCIIFTLKKAGQAVEGE